MEASRDVLARARRAGVREGAARTIAQSFCLIVGAGLIAVGVLGFFFGGDAFSTGSGVQGDDLIVFEVNGWHNVVHIATGAFLLLMAAKPASAAMGALIFGIAYAVVALLGFVDGEDILNVLATDTDDNWLHVALAALGIVVGLTSGALGMSARREHSRLEAAVAGRPVARRRRFLRRRDRGDDREVTAHGARREDG